MKAKWTEVCLGQVTTLLFILAAVGCAPTAPAPTAPPSKPTAAQPSAAKPAEQLPAKPDWQVEWDKLVAAARDEGKVVVAGPAGDLWRRALTTFEQAYPQISLELSGFSGADFQARVVTEYEVGQYLWDVFVGGPNYDYRDKDMLDPIRPMLLLPEVVDDSQWRGGLDGIFADIPKTHVIAFADGAGILAYVNRDVIREPDLQSSQELLDPRWRGRIVMHDPTISGQGNGTATTLHRRYGEQFLRELLTIQQPVITRDQRQMAQWLAGGRYPIGVALSERQLVELRQAGVQFNVNPVEGGARSLSVSSSGLHLMKRHPHPNAAKVFINWLLTQKVQQVVTHSVASNSLRLDVPPGYPEEAVDLKRLEDYVPHQHESLRDFKNRTTALAQELIK